MLHLSQRASISARSVRSLRRNYANVAASSSSPILQQHTDPARVPPYESLLNNLANVRKSLDRPLTYAEKVLFSHLVDPSEASQLKGPRGEAYVRLNPDRVAMQDASAQMALLQFDTCGAKTTAVPSSIHCDHLISAYEGAAADLKRSIVSNKEVFDFLESAARKYGIEFWRPGSGIIHQIVLENYAAPGLLMLGTDSHTPNAGGLGTIAIGVGGADAVDAMTRTPWELKAPKIIGVNLTGKLPDWTSPKDVILHLAGKLTVRGGTGSIIEYHGPGLQSISATGLATMANMGAEVGATTSTFPFTSRMDKYLRATGRNYVADAANKANEAGFLQADKGAEYDTLIDINLSELEPHINGPATPDLSTPLSKFKDFVKENGWKDEISASLIGSCTNSSYEDMGKVASIASEALKHGIKAKTPFMVTPGSELINATIERDGYKQTLQEAGGTVLANACGPCIGQWERDEYKQEENAILTSYNRNFKARNDGNRKTMNFLASPELVTAMAFSGRLSFNPATDYLTDANGKQFKLTPPNADDLPQNFTPGDTTFLPEISPKADPSVQIAISPESTRLELLKPFDPHFTPEQIANPNEPLELKDIRVLLKVEGKCTTDEISAAGSWLKYKGHLSNIAENTLIGAKNAETGRINSALDYVEGGKEDTIPEMAKRWRDRGQSWLVVTDYNYGEGSAREHAALQPRILGAKIILARSFARIHQTNLKKQGIIPLSFKNPDDYNQIGSGDLVNTKGLNELLRGNVDAPIFVQVTKKDSGKVVDIEVEHSVSSEQVKWILAGSALNLIRQQKLAEAEASS